MRIDRFLDQPSQLNKDSLNKYKKKPTLPNKPVKQQTYNRESTSTTSKNQFQKYFLDATNVFFQDRQSLKQLQETRLKLKLLLPVWFIVAISYLVISRIHGFQGDCPQNATCKVFIRCNPGYELSPDGGRCTMKASIISHIQNICKFQIDHLKHQYGDNDCIENVTHNLPPYKHVNDLIQSITPTLVPSLQMQVQRRIFDFLNNQTNQISLQFSFINSKVIPLARKHSFSCWVDLTSRTKEFKIGAVIFTLLLVLSIFTYINYKKQQRVKEIYNYLKEKVIAQNKLNITLLTDQIKSIFGLLDQNTWIKIDEERKKDGKIGYFEDEFLFWKLI